MSCIKIENIRKAYSRELFGGMNFVFKKNSPFAVTGPNGSGKSTLINIISFFTVPDEGSVTCSLGGNLLSARQTASITGVISSSYNPYDEMSCSEIAFFTARGDRIRAESVLDNFQLAGINPEEKFGKLSDGYRQRVKICLAFCAGNEIFLLDEPYVYLDGSGRALLDEFIAANKNSVMIIASNDKRDLKSCVGELRIG